MRHINLSSLAIPILSIVLMIACKSDNRKVLVCYGRVPIEQIQDFGFVILEAKNYSKEEVGRIKKKNETVIAYISLGEVNEHADHYKDLSAITLGKNKQWSSYYLDIENPKTTEVLSKVIAQYLAKGYDGIFLDNIDNYTIFGPQKDQTTGLVKFLKTLRAKYPKKVFVQNAGLSLLPETSKYVDAVLVESVATMYDFKSKEYKLSTSEHFTSQLEKLEEIKNNYDMPVILVEYADSKSLRAKVIERVEPTSFSYFIGKIDLQSVPNFK